MGKILTNRSQVIKICQTFPPSKFCSIRYLSNVLYYYSKVHVHICKLANRYTYIVVKKLKPFLCFFVSVTCYYAGASFQSITRNFLNIPVTCLRGTSLVWHQVWLFYVWLCHSWLLHACFFIHIAQ